MHKFKIGENRAHHLPGVTFFNLRVTTGLAFTGKRQKPTKTHKRHLNRTGSQDLCSRCGEQDILGLLQKVNGSVAFVMRKVISMQNAWKACQHREEGSPMSPERKEAESH